MNKNKGKNDGHPDGDVGQGKAQKLSKKAYEKSLSKLQLELVKLAEFVRVKGLRVVVIFEGRDAAGKGGTIKRITEALNPRYCCRQR